MERVKNIFNNVSKKHVILWGGLLVVFILAAIFVYVNYIQPQLVEKEYEENYEFDETIKNTNSGSGIDTITKKVDLYLFWACWCPNSNKEGATGTRLHGVWDKIEDDYKNGKWGTKNFKINFKKIEENDAGFTTSEQIVKNGSGIEGFPSIFLRFNDKDGVSTVYEFDASPTEENIKEFIKTVLKI